MSNQWIPPGFRACTWDEAQWMNKDGGLRAGMSRHGQALSWHRGAGDCIAWLCIDTPKPQHTHADKPWVAMGFEECSFDEAPRDGNGRTLGMYERGIEWATASRKQPGLFTPLRPSPLLGLKRALETIDAQRGTAEVNEAIGWLLAEIAKYEPPVCSSCGQPVTRKGEP